MILGPAVNRIGAGLLVGVSLVGCAEEGAPGESALLDPDGPAWEVAAPDTVRALFETSAGAFLIEAVRAWAPIGVDRFYNLVRHGFYDDMRINRVRAGFIAQFGVHGEPGIAAVWRDRALPDDPVRASNVRGTLAYAMTGPDTRTTQIYINYADNSRLDAQGFAPIGRVVSGMESVDSLYAGYDETAGGGMRGGQQGPLFEGGNAYLDREFPLLDRIIRATISGGDGR